MSNRNANEIKVSIIHMIMNLLNLSKALKLIPFKVTLTVLLREVYDASKTLVHSNISEELKLAIIECIDIAFQRIESDSLMEFYTKENTQILSKICFVCVHMISMESYKKLK